LLPQVRRLSTTNPPLSPSVTPPTYEHPHDHA
jgi:hypothetical protein